MNTQLQRARYVQDAIVTATPARLLTMLYYRLVRDLRGAELAIMAGDHDEVNSLLIHAQDIVLELQSTLNLDAWSGARGLNELYSFVYSELIQANIRKDERRVDVCLNIIEPLQAAWHEAALQLAGTAGKPTGGVRVA